MASDEIKEAKELLKLKQEEIRKEIQLNGVKSDRLKTLQREERMLKSSLNQLNDIYDTQDELGKKQQELRDGMNQFGQAIANLPLGEYMNLVPVTQDISSALTEVQANIDKVSRQINQDFAKQNLAIPKPNTKAFKSVISELEMKQAGLGKDLQEALMSGDIATFYKKYGDEGRKMAKEAMDKKKGFVGVATYFGKDGQGPKDLKTFQDGMRKIEEEARGFYKVTFDTSKLMGGIRQNILQNFGLKRIIDQVVDFDNKLANLKKEFQIPAGNFRAASEAMADLTVKGAKFGLTNEQSFEMVKTIGDEMKSTNVKNLSAIAQSVAAVPAAMGIASSEVAKITGQMMFFGQQSDKVQSAFKNIGKQSAVFGQNATKVAKQFGDAYPKFKMMGMKGNESAIAAMAAQAEKLGINLADSVQSSKDFLDIGQAMEAAADLSLLGGAAAQVSYADLMQARLDPKKMIEIQDKVTAGLGKFNKATGEVDFGYADLVQMQQLAERLGVKQEDLMKRAKGQREDAAKAAVFDQNMFKGLSPEEKTFLLSKVVSKGGGKFGLEGFDGIKDLKGLSAAQVKAQMAGAVQDKKSLEDQAKERASFEETVNRMKGTIMALFNRFQPILQMLTNVLGKVIDVAQGFSNAITKIFGATVGKYVKASLALGAILMLTMGPSAMAKFSGILFRGFTSPLKSLSGFGAKLSAAFKGGGGKTAETLSEKAGGAAADLGGKMKGGKAGPTFLQQFAKISPTQILSVAAAMIALGAAMMMIGKGIQFASNGLTGLVKAFNDSKNAGMALAAVGVVMGGFVAMLALMPPIITAIGAAGTFAAPGLLALGVTFLGIGFGVYLASKGLAAVASAMVMIGKNIGAAFKGAAGLVALAGALVMISPALVIFGAASLIAVPGMFALGFLLKGLGAAKGVNPGIIKAVADSMGSIAWGLFKLGAAAVAAPLAILSAKALNYVASAINGLGKIDPAKAISFGMTLTLFANSVAKGLGRLAWMGLGAPLALLAAFSINRISKLLNDIKPVDQKNITAFANSLGSIGIKMAWGLTKLALVAVPALAALPGAKLLAVISNMLNGVKPVNPNNMALFGKSLGQVSGKVLFGLTKLAIVSVVELLALPGALMLNRISNLLNGVKAVDPKKMAAFGSSLAQVTGKVLWGLTKLSVVSVVGAIALPGAFMLNKISNLLNGVKPVNEKNMAAFGKSLSQVTGKVLWGLTKLSVVSVVGLLALPGALMLYKISQYLNAVKPVNEKNMAAFGKSIGQVGPKVMSGIKMLALMAIPSLLASVAANRIAGISKSLNSIIPINKEKIASFANAMGQISGKLVWGVVKLGLIALPAILATTAANRLVAISKTLNALVPVNPAKIMLFATSMGMVSSKMLWGMVKLALIAIPAIPAVSAANRLVAISKSLNALVPVNPANIMLFANSMGMVSTKMLWGMIKLALLAIPAIPAVSAANRLVTISKSLNALAPVNPANIMLFATSLSKSTSKILWGIIKLALIAIPAIPAVSAANRLVSISKSLNSITPVNSTKMTQFATSLGTIGLKVLWGITKLALIAIPASAATNAAIRLSIISKALNSISPIDLNKIQQFGLAMGTIGGKILWGIGKMSLIALPAIAAVNTAGRLIAISKNLNGITPVNTANIKQLSQGMASVGGFALTKFGLLALPAKGAASTARSVLAISSALSKINTVNTKKIESVNKAMDVVSGRILGLFALLAAPAKGALSTARSLMNIAKNLNAIVPVNLIKVLSLNTAMSVVEKLKGKIKTLAGMSSDAGKSASVALSLFRTSLYLSLVRQPNVPAIQAFGKALESISGKVIGGVQRLASILRPISLANLSSSYILNISRNLSQVKSPNIPAMQLFGLSLEIISLKVMKGITKLGLLYFPLILANKSASLLASTSRSLNAVKPPNVAAMDLFAASLVIISRKVMWGVVKLGLLVGPLTLANKSASLLASTSKSLGLVKAPNIGAMALFGASLSLISGKVVWGVTKLGLLYFPLVLAYRSASLMASTSARLAQVKAPALAPIQAFGKAVSEISGKVMWGVTKLGLLLTPLVLATKSASLMASVSKNLLQVKAPNLAPIQAFGQAMGLISGRLMWGVTKLALLSVPLAISIVSAKLIIKLSQTLISATNSILTIVKAINKVPIANKAGLSSLSKAIGELGLGFSFKLLKFGLIRFFVGGAITASEQLVRLGNILNKIPRVSSAPLKSISSALSVVGLKFTFNLAKLAVLTPLLAAASYSANILNRLAQTLSKMPRVSTLPLKSLSNTLSEIGAKFIFGLGKLAFILPLSATAALSAISLNKIGQALGRLPITSKVPLQKLNDTMSEIGLVFGKNLLVLAGLSVPAAGAAVAAVALGSIGRNLASIPMTSTKPIQTLGKVMGTIGGSVTKGLFKLASLNAVGPLAKTAATNLSIITRELAKAVGPNMKALSTLGFALTSIVKAIPAIIRLSKMNAVSKLAATAASQIAVIGQNLKRLPEVNNKAMIALGVALGVSMQRIRTGVSVLARTVSFMPQGIIASKGLSVIANNIKTIPQVSFAGLSSLGRVLSSQMSRVLIGTRQLSRLVALIPSSILSAQGLARVANAIRSIPQVPFVGLLSLGNVLSSQMPKVLNGVRSLSRVRALIPASIISSKGLQIISAEIKKVPQVFLLGLASLGRVLSTQMPKVITGVRLLVRAIPYIPASIVSARGLAIVSRTISTIPQVFFIGLSSIGRVLSSQMPRVIVGLSRLIKVIPLISSSIVAASGVAAISRTLKTITPINAKAIMDLAKVVNAGGSLFLKGILKWSMLSAIMGPAVRAIGSVARIFTSLNSIGAVDGPKIMLTLPSLNKMAGSLLSFSKIGIFAPFLIAASVAVGALGKSLGTAAAGFEMFAKVPWNMMNMAAKNMKEVVGALNSVANKVAISPSLSTLARTLYILGFAMKSVSVGFSSSAKAMAEFNAQSERLKVNTGKAEITAKSSAARALTDKGAASGASKPVTVFNPTAPTTGERIKIAPIEINLKLNGMQIQKLIAEANFYRT